MQNPLPLQLLKIMHWYVFKQRPKDDYLQAPRSNKLGEKRTEKDVGVQDIDKRGTDW